MAVQYIREKTKQKYYLIVFLIVIIITFTVLWFGFLKDKFSFLGQTSVKQPSSFALPLREINIDFNFLDSQTIKDLEQFNPVLPFEGEAGREQPFSPPSVSGSGLTPQAGPGSSAIPEGE